MTPLRVRILELVEVAETVRTEEVKLVEVAEVVVPIENCELALSIANNVAEEMAFGEE